MSASIRHRLSPIAGVVSLAFGIALVAAVKMLPGSIGEPAVAAQTSVVDRSSTVEARWQL